MEEEMIVSPVERPGGKLPGTFDAGILYSVIAIYYTYLSGRILAFGLPESLNILLPELLFIALPPLALAYLRHYDIKKTFRFKAPRPMEVVVVLIMSPVMVIAGACAGFAALLAIKSTFGSVNLASGAGEVMTGGLGLALLIIAVVPAVCEEILFRGMIQRGLEGLGAGWSVLLSGVLFGLFHFDFQRLAAQTLIGIVAAYVVYRTGSIINGMLLHFANNGLLTLLANLATGAAQGSGGELEIITDPFETPEFLDLAAQNGMSLEQLLGIVSIVLLVIMAFCLFVVFGLCIILKGITAKTLEKPQRKAGSFKGLLTGLPGLILIGLVYTAIGLSLVGSDWGERLLRIIGIG